MERGCKTIGALFVSFILIAFSTAPVLSAGMPLWTDDFEGNWQNCWHVDAGTWEVGTPTSGPGTAYNGTNCAATILAGNYGNYVDSRLIRHCPFVVPDADQDPGLRFWHWFSFYPNDDDYGRVQIRVVGDTVWTTLAECRNSGGDVWSRTFVPLSDYAGQTVEIAFYFHSDNAFQQEGWYIDDVSLEEGARVFTGTQDWESGLEDWHADFGTWEVGLPTSGPGSAHDGGNCVATRLEGVYSNYADSRLISPPFAVPEAAQDPRLRFWHWFNFYPNDDDYGQVQIRAMGDTDWTTLAECRNSGGDVWSRTLVPLSDYAGQTVEIAFYFHSDNAFQQEGWYIDDVSLEEGARVFTSTQDWESGLEDWHADFGTWEVGLPTSGPGSAHDGGNCVATRLEGVYSNYADSRLISPPFVVCPAVANPVLRFWHWYYFYINDNDFGQVQIRVVGDTDWNTLATYSNHGGGIWSQPYIPISDYAGQTVEIAFYFHSDNAFQQDGWYIDDIILQGVYTEVMHDYEPDGDVDGGDLHYFANSFDPGGLARFALEFGLITCQ